VATSAGRCTKFVTGAEPPALETLRAALAGRNLACWCALNGPCHADLLLALANAR